MEFFQKFTPPDFKVKNFTPSISPYFNSFDAVKHLLQNNVKNGHYTAIRMEEWEQGTQKLHNIELENTYL